MSVSNADYLKSLYFAGRTLGDKSVSSDAYFEIEGYPTVGLLTKQFPWPTMGPAGEIEGVGPMGTGFWKPQQHIGQVPLRLQRARQPRP